MTTPPPPHAPSSDDGESAPRDAARHDTTADARTSARGEGDARAAQDTIRWRAPTAQMPRLPRSSRALRAVALAACAVGIGFGTSVDATRSTQSHPRVLTSLPLELPAAATPVVVQGASRQGDTATARATAEKPRARSREQAQRPGARIVLRGLALDVSATPWMDVELDGRRVGSTPLRDVKLSEGIHDVVLVNRDLGLETTVMLRADADSEETQEISFE